MRDYEDDPQCACPSADARRCVEFRYPRPMGVFVGAQEHHRRRSFVTGEYFQPIE